MTVLIRSSRTYLAICLLLALFYRLDFLFASNFVIDADEAIVGLMGKHIAEGRGFPIFYYGQPYMGSLEACCAALFFKLLGVSSFALRMVPLFFSLLLVVLFYYLGLAFGNRSVARAAALLCALPPAALLEWGARARGGFIEILVISALALLACAAFFRAFGISGRLVWLIGFLLGLGWWTNNQIIYLMPACGLAVCGRILHESRRVGRDLLACGVYGSLGFLFGSAPFWYYNFTHDFASFGLFHAAESTDILTHLSGVFSISLPILLGASRFWQTSEVFPCALGAAYFLYLYPLLLVAYFRAPQLRSSFKLRFDEKAPLELNWILLLTIIVVFSVSSFGNLVQAPRYLLPIYLPLFLLCASGIAVIYKRNQTLWRVYLLALLTLHLCSFYLGGRAIPGEPFVYKGQRVSKDHSALISWLERNRYPFIHTNYWIGYRLAFETKERVRFLMIKDPGQVRIESYEKEAEAYTGEIPWVTVPAQAELIESALKLAGYDYQKVELSSYVVLYGLAAKQLNLVPVPQASISIAASDHAQDAALAIDGDERTRWGSATPQHPGMKLELQLDPPRRLRSLRFEMAGWPQDYPRKLGVRLISPQGDERRLLHPSESETMRLLFGSDSHNNFCFEPFETSRVVLEQEGSHPVFDWSVAELRLFE